MGVYGLLSHCLQHRDQCVEYVDLVEVAASKADGIEILCDFYCLEHMLVESFWRSLWLLSQNSCIEILGGEYSSLGEYVSKLICDLQSLKIRLVMYVDGAKGTMVHGLHQKWDTWENRHHRDLAKMRERLNVLRTGHGLKEPFTDNFRPVLLEVQLMETLKQCGCEVVHCVSFEADLVLAKNLASRPSAFAILSNDSDFCVFDNSCFIPFDLFDVKGNLGLGTNQRLPTKPSSLEVGMMTSKKVWSFMGLQNQDEMIEFSILRGNDFTSSFMRQLKHKVGLGKGSQLVDAVDWIKKYHILNNNRTFADELARDRELKEAVDYSRKFYRLEIAVSDVAHSDYLTNFIADGVARGEIPSNILAMNLGMYWHRMLIEEEGRHFPIAEVALMPLRSFIYRMILPEGKNAVKEYGRMSSERDFDCHTVPAAKQRFIPRVDKIAKDKIFANLGTFDKIMSHQEQCFRPEWHKRYGWRNGFKCYILRYFLVLNFNKNLHITLDEFLPLVALTFAQVDVEFYQGLCILPDGRSLTVANWFQDVYRHAYYFLGKLLGLSEQFPRPCDIFSGAVWTAFYMHSTHRIRHISHENFQRIRTDLDYLIREKRHIIRYLVDGFFPFDTRF